MSKINYDLERIKGIVFDVDGVLSPSTIPMDSEGMPSRMVNIKDGYALQLAVKLGYKIAIITGGYSPAIKARFNGLGITDIYMKAGKKIDVLKQWMDANGLLSEEVAYVGDDIPDYEVMQHAGLAVAPLDAAVDISFIPIPAPISSSEPRLCQDTPIRSRMPTSKQFLTLPLSPSLKRQPQ